MNVARNLIDGYVGLLKYLRQTALALIANLRIEEQRKDGTGDNGENKRDDQKLDEREAGRGVIGVLHLLQPYLCTEVSRLMGIMAWPALVWRQPIMIRLPSMTPLAARVMMAQRSSKCAPFGELGSFGSW